MASLPPELAAIGMPQLKEIKKFCERLRISGGRWEGRTDNAVAMPSPLPEETPLVSPPRWLWAALAVICPREHAAAREAVDVATAMALAQRGGTYGAGYYLGAVELPLSVAASAIATMAWKALQVLVSVPLVEDDDDDDDD